METAIGGCAESAQLCGKVKGAAGMSDVSNRSSISAQYPRCLAHFQIQGHLLFTSSPGIAVTSFGGLRCPITMTTSCFASTSQSRDVSRTPTIPFGDRERLLPWPARTGAIHLSVLEVQLGAQWTCWVFGGPAAIPGRRGNALHRMCRYMDRRGGQLS